MSPLLKAGHTEGERSGKSLECPGAGGGGAGERGGKLGPLQERW